MHALRRLFANDSASPVLAGKLDTAVNDVLREAEELCCLLRRRREGLKVDATPKPITLNDMSNA